MRTALLVVDVQNGFIDQFARHIPARITNLIQRDEHSPVLFTRFVNIVEPFAGHGQGVSHLAFRNPNEERATWSLAEAHG